MPPSIKPKKKPVIKAGANYVYDINSFKEYDFIIECKTAAEMMALFGNDPLLAVDTECRPLTEFSNKDFTSNLVRRWIGSGKKAVPVDIPFCVSVCNGIVAATLYDTLDNNFAEIKKLTFLWNEAVTKILHNAKFDLHMLKNIGIDLKGAIHDTLIIAKLVDENRKSYALMDLVKGGIIEFEYMVDNYKKTHKVADYSLIPRRLMTQYAGADVWNTFKVYKDEFPQIAIQDMAELFYTEMVILLCCFDMERVGMRVDKEYESTLKQELQAIADATEQEIYAEAGRIFNINSGAQIHQVLLDMGVDNKIFKYTPSSIEANRLDPSKKLNVCLDKDEINRLATVVDIPLIKKILVYKNAEKMLTTYAVGIYDQADANYDVHCNINQGEAVTGRMSITKPALQTLPKKDKRIRSAFIAREGFDLIAMDLDQIEYRIYADYSKEEALIRAINNGYDVHTATAGIIFNEDIEHLTQCLAGIHGEELQAWAEELRAKAKTVNFALIYGAGAEKLAASLSDKKQTYTINDAYRMKDRYFAALPNAKPFMKGVERAIINRGFIFNKFKRRRRLSSNDCYKAVNSLVQGCGADYLKSKMAIMYLYLKEGNYKSRLLLPIHDELLMEIHHTERHLIPILRELMSEYDMFKVKLTAGVDQCSPDWGHKTKWEEVA